MQQPDLSDLAANLKLAILIESVAMIVGNWIDGPYREPILWVTIIVSFQAFCGYLANFRFLVACSLLGVLNLGVSALFCGLIYYFGGANGWITFFWVLCTSALGIVSVLLAWIARSRYLSNANTD